jgi:hypothetical protein
MRRDDNPHDEAAHAVLRGFHFLKWTLILVAIGAVVWFLFRRELGAIFLGTPL